MFSFLLALQVFCWFFFSIIHLHKLPFDFTYTVYCELGFLPRSVHGFNIPCHHVFPPPLCFSCVVSWNVLVFTPLLLIGFALYLVFIFFGILSLIIWVLFLVVVVFCPMFLVSLVSPRLLTSCFILLVFHPVCAVFLVLLLSSCTRSEFSCVPQVCPLPSLSCESPPVHCHGLLTLLCVSLPRVCRDSYFP